MSSTVTYGARNRTGETASLAQEYNADITFSQILANHDRVVDAIQPGSEVASYAVTGTDRDDNAFDISFTERYTSQWDIAFESIFEIADIVWLLSRMEGVTLDDVTATADVSDDTTMYRLRKLEQKRGGDWVNLGRRKPAVATAGRTLHLRATLRDPEGTRRVPLKLAIPANAKRRGFVQVTGGASTWDSGIYQAKTPAAMEEAVAAMVRNDEIAATLYFARRGKGSTTQVTSPAQDQVVRGRKFAEVLVRR